MVPGESLDEQLLELEQLNDALAYIEAGVDPIEWVAQKHQQPPPGDDWWGWLLIGGRNAGKSAAVCASMNEHAESEPCFPGRVPHRMGIIAPTLGDAAESVVYGEAGLLAHNPRIELRSRLGGTYAYWPNGARAKMFGTNTMDAVNRLRSGGNRCFDLAEEIAAWRYLKAALEHMELGLRKGTSHWVGATTPKARPSIRALNEDAKVVKSYATSDDNAFADPEWLKRIHDRFDGTRMGLQEVKGLILDDVEGALWTIEQCLAARVDELPKLRRVVVCVDPSWGTMGDEVGIIVVGLGVDARAYVLADLSGRMTPSEWGRVAGTAYLRKWHGVKPDRILAEKNFQGEQVKLVARIAEAELKAHLEFDFVSASQGKRLRAEPVVGLYEQGRVRHFSGAEGGLDALDFEMSNWVPPSADGTAEDKGDPPEPRLDDEGNETTRFSPGRIDGMVYGVTHFLLGESVGSVRVVSSSGRVPRSISGSGRATLNPQQRRIVERQLRKG